MRTLFYVPIIHTSADLGSLAPAVNRRGIAGLGEELWTQHRLTVEGFWKTIAVWFDSVNVAGMKLYQDGMITDGEVGQKIVEAGVKAGSQNYELVDRLLRRGALLVKTEDFALVKQERDRLLAMTQTPSTTRKLIAFLKYQFVKKRLLEKRDRFIAEQIAKTLPEGRPVPQSPLDDGGTGILLIGAYHMIRPKLSADIQVREVKDIQKVREYQKLLPFYRTHKERFEALGRYLVAPVELSPTVSGTAAG